MNWQLKCAAFHVLAHVPARRRVYKFLQHYITRRSRLTVTDFQLRRYGQHVQVYAEKTHSGTSLEFGAGRHLLTPLLLSAAGAKIAYAFDIERLATSETVNHTIRQLRGRVPGDWPEVSDLNEDLVHKYRIHYHAPADIGELPAECVDFIYSTSTLEHVPAGAIRPLLTQCLRVASARAVISFRIDYADHYAIDDKSITPFNFYRFSDRAWRIFNPPTHHQNRLRHSDFERLLAETGFTFARNTRNVLDEKLPPSLRIADCFRQYTREDLLTRGGHFVLVRSTHTP